MPKSARPSLLAGRGRVPRAKSAPEELLALQMRADGIMFEREVRLIAGRRWRWDFVVRGDFPPLAIEVQGWGRHQRFIGFEKDCEKAAAALIAGYRTLAVTPRQVKSGQALDWIRRLI